MTQEALAYAAGLHPTEVSRLERGERNPQMATVVALAHALGVTSGDLLRDVDATFGSRSRGDTQQRHPHAGGQHGR